MATKVKRYTLDLVTPIIKNLKLVNHLKLVEKRHFNQETIIIRKLHASIVVNQDIQLMCVEADCQIPHRKHHLMVSIIIATSLDA